MNTYFVFDVTVHPSEVEYVHEDAVKCEIKEWAEENGFEFFPTSKGFAFKGKTVPNYKVNEHGTISICLDHEQWDTMCLMKEIAIRFLDN